MKIFFFLFFHFGIPMERNKRVGMFDWYNSFLICFLLIFFVGCSEYGLPEEKETLDLSVDRNDSIELQKRKELKALDSFDEGGRNLFAQDNNMPEEMKLPLPKKLESLDPPDGLVREFFEDGSVKEELRFVDGVKEGSRKIWYANGQISKSGFMKEDRWHGEYKEWYSTGVPKVSGQYLEGKQDGEWKFYDKEGNALPDLFFKNGVETTRHLPSLLKD